MRLGSKQQTKEVPPGRRAGKIGPNCWGEILPCNADRTFVLQFPALTKSTGSPRYAWATGERAWLPQLSPNVMSSSKTRDAKAHLNELCQGPLFRGARTLERSAAPTRSPSWSLTWLTGRRSNLLDRSRKKRVVSDFQIENKYSRKTRAFPNSTPYPFESLPANSITDAAVPNWSPLL